MPKKKIITRIEAQKKNPRRRSVFIDGKFAFGLDEEVVSKLGLKKEEALTESRIEEILGQKSENDTIEKLKEYDLINDFEFATAWVKERLAHKPRGKKLLKHELWKKGVKKDIIDQVTEESCQDEDKSASKLLEKIKKRYRNLEPEVARRRMLSLLLRRGFSYENAKNALTHLISSSCEEQS